MFNIEFTWEMLGVGFLVLAYIVFGLGLRTGKKVNVLIGSSVFNLLMIVYFITFGAFSGVVISIIAVIRNIYFYRRERLSGENPLWSLFLFSAVIIVSNLLVFEGWRDILMMGIALIGVFQFWYKNDKITHPRHPLHRNNVVLFGNLFMSAFYIAFALTLPLRYGWLPMALESYAVLTAAMGVYKNFKLSR